MSVMSVMVITLENWVKKWRRLRIWVAETPFFVCGPAFDLFTYFQGGHVTLFGHLTTDPKCLPEPKKEKLNVLQARTGWWIHRKSQVCGRIIFVIPKLKLCTSKQQTNHFLCRKVTSNV